MVIILPPGGQLQNYLKLDLGELENYFWAHVESKISKKKKKIAGQLPFSPFIIFFSFFSLLSFPIPIPIFYVLFFFSGTQP